MVAGASEATGAGPSHPGPPAVTIPLELREALVAHARAEYPNEACGIVVGSGLAADGGAPLRFVPTRNRAVSPYRYEIHPDDLFRVADEADERDEAIWAIFHSHTHTAARPSETDVRLAAWWPDAIYLLVSLAPEAGDADGSPGLRAWRIVDGAVYEVTLRAGAPAPHAGEAASPAADATRHAGEAVPNATEALHTTKADR